ncbi:HupK protein [Tabrizicola caldifontis]|uniref:HupK protein n=1 Tax=Tabrizicola caldifontis TaxID=2528036 RepID=UPI00108106F0|nr:HupK protein [Rhodobacter sp. YIM 73028]
MTLSAASVTLGPVPGISAGPALPVEALVIGKPVAMAADLLPRLFNLCRGAQAMAARLSLGLPATDDPRAEILRDHRLKLCVMLPRAFGLDPIPLPEPTRPHQPLALPGAMDAAALLGPEGLPDMPSRLAGPLAPLFHRVAATFPPGMATCAALPLPSAPLADGAFENSPAGRQSHHPLLRRIEQTHGRGPLWRLAGLMADLEAVSHNRLPAPALSADGTATVPAARGIYALRVTQRDGVVTGLCRRTPTDHQLAPGGALLQSLANLPATHRALAPKVIALHDPCIPVTVREAEHA